MKKRFVLISLIIIFLSITLVSLASALTLDERINNSYNWLAQKDTSSSIPQSAFKLIAFSSNPSISGPLQTKIQNPSNILESAYASIALKSIGVSTSTMDDSLYNSKIATKQDLEWNLQIDNRQNKALNCNITYMTNDAATIVNVLVGADKKYSGFSSQECLEISTDSYWLKIKTVCAKKKFSVDCDVDQGSLASIVFRSGVSSPTYSVLADAKQIPADLVAEAYCLPESSGGSICNYESTLWTTYSLALSGKLTSAETEKDKRKVQVDEFLPYLTSSSDADSYNHPVIKNALLLLITSQQQYETNLLMNQTPSGLWNSRTSTPDYWDTAVAARALSMNRRDSPNMTKLIEVFNSSDWDSDAHSPWGVMPTALFLYSVFPQRYITSCEAAANADADHSEDFRCSKDPLVNYVENNTFDCETYAGTTSDSLGKCYQLSPCTRAGLTCNASRMDPNRYPVALRCGSDKILGTATCWNASACFENRGECKTPTTDILKEYTEMPQYNVSCNSPSSSSLKCYNKTMCAYLGGTCLLSSADANLMANSDPLGCSVGLKCYQPSPCKNAGLTCAKDKCPSGTEKRPDVSKYYCNKDAGMNTVCCRQKNSPQCDTSSANFKCTSDCKTPYKTRGDLVCSDDSNSCCELVDTCTTNQNGYSCKPFCSTTNETQVSGLVCSSLTTTGSACCKPSYTCAAANNTCRTSCLSSEKNTSTYSCPGSNVCCEKVPVNLCVSVYGFNCKASCAAGETKLTYSCSSGVCCAANSNVTCSTLYDCKTKPECNNQIVQDLYFRNVKCEYGKELTCNDNKDNDGDGFVDNQDPDCPTCSNKGYSCCSSCESGHSQSSLDSSCSSGVCCDKNYCASTAATCSSEGYECCDECAEGEEKSVYDGSCLGQSCCSSCKTAKKSNAFLYIILIILLLGIGGGAYYYFFILKKKKPKSGGAPPGFPESGFRPAVRPYLPPVQQRPGMQQRPGSYMPSPPSSIQLRPSPEKPKPTKTESELEETLNKLKRMSGK